MLSLFNRFLSRLRSAHPIFGNKNLLIIIIEYLDGSDVFQLYQVSFLFKTTIISEPKIEAIMLRHSLKQSNACIDRLRSEVSQPQTLSLHPQRLFNSSFPFRSRLKNSNEATQKHKVIITEPNFNEEKWVNFVDYFHEYAKKQGFVIKKRTEFTDENEWKAYRTKYTGFYHQYVDHIRNSRSQQRPDTNFKQKLYDRYSNIVQNLNFSFHYFTNYRYFKSRPERENRPRISLKYTDYF